MNDYELRKQEKLEMERTAKRKKVVRQTALWFSVIAGIGLVIWGMIYFVSREKPVLTNDSAAIENIIFADDIVKGNKDAKVILIEYSDFQCSACAFYYPIVEKLSEEFGDKLAIVYRHFPLPNHQHAKPMAYATEAAGRQGKFWEMHDMIFDNQKEWAAQSVMKGEKTIEEYAKSLELNIEQFEKDFESKEIKEKVEKHYRGGVKADVTYTPTFFLNGEKIQNPRNYEEFRNIINQAISNNP